MIIDRIVKESLLLRASEETVCKEEFLEEELGYQLIKSKAVKDFFSHFEDVYYSEKNNYKNSEKLSQSKIKKEIQDFLNSNKIEFQYREQKLPKVLLFDIETKINLSMKEDLLVILSTDEIEINYILCKKYRRVFLFSYNEFPLALCMIKDLYFNIRSRLIQQFPDEIRKELRTVEGRYDYLSDISDKSITIAKSSIEALYEKLPNKNNIDIIFGSFVFYISYYQKETRIFYKEFLENPKLLTDVTENMSIVKLT